MADLLDIDFRKERSIANENNINNFIKNNGGELISEKYQNLNFKNADYIFVKDQIIIELKTIQTEFFHTDSFKIQQKKAYEETVQVYGEKAMLKWSPHEFNFYNNKIDNIYRERLARIVKKANRQIKETRSNLNLNNFRGILMLVNDGFREIDPIIVNRLLARILNGDNNNIKALIYLTNHYVHIPGNDNAMLLWVPLYNPSNEDLSDFVNELGAKWFAYVEEIQGFSFDCSVRTDSYDALLIAKTIK